MAVGIIAVAVAVDQLTKAWAEAALSDGRTIAVLPTVEFDLSYNSGFSFSTGTGYGQLIGAVVIAVCVYLIRLIVREASARRAGLFAVILAGALGNLCDRLFRADNGVLSGEVVDFIDVSWFAVFNVADICVVGGAVVFGIVEAFFAGSANDRVIFDDHP